MKKNERKNRFALAAPTSCALLLLAALLAPLPARAHENHTTEVLLVLAADGSWQLSLAADLDALALGVSPAAHTHGGGEGEHAEKALSPADRLRALPSEELESKIEDLKDYLLRRVRVRFDGESASPNLVIFPEQSAESGESVLGGKAMLLGRVPDGAKEASVQLSRSFPRFRLTVLRESSLSGEVSEVEKGGRSRGYLLDQGGG